MIKDIHSRLLRVPEVRFVTRLNNAAASAETKLGVLRTCVAILQLNGSEK
jgi:hypothetical protein